MRKGKEAMDVVKETEQAEENDKWGREDTKENWAGWQREKRVQEDLVCRYHDYWSLSNT